MFRKISQKQAIKQFFDNNKKEWVILGFIKWYMSYFNPIKINRVHAVMTVLHIYQNTIEFHKGDCKAVSSGTPSMNFT